jgi:D-beta-D-heptose 7-phosphate kinase/D-beta-D-heptose 1-phosphate adenosyltransferase
MKPVAVVGDLILDIFIYGTSSRLNPEGPSPLITHQKQVKKFGGAANVVDNLKSLGLLVDFYSANTSPSKKTRVISDGITVCRVDEDIQSYTLDLNSILTDEYKFIIISDYNKGAIGNCVNFIQKTASKVFVDPKKSFDNYYGAFCIKPNKQEFIDFFGDQPTPENIKTFAKSNNHELVIVTLGKDGLIYYFDGEVRKIKSFANEVVDVTGAGDSFMASLVYSIDNGKSIHEAIYAANLGAKAAVEKTGTYSVTKKDLNYTKVFTNGCFDILHDGHIKLLTQSRNFGDYLILGLNSDESVKRNKGDERPINKQKQRILALENTELVDEIIVFEEDTPYELIKQVKPDIITKGGDYNPKEIVGADLAEVRIVPYLRGYSTTSIIQNEKLRNS